MGAIRNYRNTNHFKKGFSSSHSNIIYMQTINKFLED